MNELKQTEEVRIGYGWGWSVVEKGVWWGVVEDGVWLGLGVEDGV